MDEQNAIPIRDFEDLLRRNLASRYQGGGLSIHYERFGVRAGLAPDIATIVIGAPREGNCLNVPVPRVPENSYFSLDAEGQPLEKKAEGWRAILTHWTNAGVIEKTPEVLKILEA